MYGSNCLVISPWCREFSVLSNCHIQLWFMSFPTICIINFTRLLLINMIYYQLIITFCVDEQLDDHLKVIEICTCHFGHQITISNKYVVRRFGVGAEFQFFQFPTILNSFKLLQRISYTWKCTIWHFIRDSMYTKPRDIGQLGLSPEIEEKTRWPLFLRKPDIFEYLKSF